VKEVTEVADRPATQALAAVTPVGKSQTFAPLARVTQIIDSTAATAANVTRAAAASAAQAATSIASQLAQWTNLSADGEAVVAAAASSAAAPAAAGPAKVEAFVAEAVAAAVAPVAARRVFEFASLGSPFTLLADSVAAFVEDSAAMPRESSPLLAAAAPAQPNSPWALTATVIAADIVLLTYMHRRRIQARRLAEAAMA
jgi:hypothetical protein